MTLRRTIVALGLLPLGIAAWGPTPDARRLSAADVAALRAIADRDAPIVLARDWATLVAEYSEDAVRMAPNGPPVQGGTPTFRLRSNAGSPSAAVTRRRRTRSGAGRA